MEEIYFDNSSTTCVDQQVAELALHMMCEEFGNPSSLHHRGVEAQKRMEKASRQLLAALGARSGKILFTSGGTESNNLAIFGAVRARKRYGNRIVTSQIEHSSVEAPVCELKKQGFDCVFVQPEPDGTVDPERFLSACKEDTILASLMMVNNETGAIQPLQESVARLRKQAPHALIHTDAVQAFGKIPFQVSKLNIDLLSLSGHKIHAPKGVGALYLADKVLIAPMLYGGGQQGTLRPGTENVPLIAALGMAGEGMTAQLSGHDASVRAIREHLISELSHMPGVVLHLPQHASPYILNLSVMGYRSETMLHFLESKGIYVSSGSACSKGARSHVLLAMGLSQKEADSALRLSFCKYNTICQADAFLAALQEGMHTLRRAN